VPTAFYPQEDSWYSFLLEAEPRAIVQLEGLGKLKKSTSSGTQTSDLPACSIVLQPCHCVPLKCSKTQKILQYSWLQISGNKYSSYAALINRY
jgi:hypothetical protein